VAYPDVPIWLELARLGRDFALSAARSALPHPELSDIQRYCLFMGAPRNGHSLIGAMLDAHPKMLVAHELGIPKYLATHFSRRQIQLLLITNSRRNASRGRQHIHYSHAVPGQWQGRYDKLQVIGDKHGEGFLLSVQARPWLVQAVIEGMTPAHFIHVLRNPYDAIASVMTSSKRGRSLDRAIGYFEGLYETLGKVQDALSPEQWFELRFEDFLEHPQRHLGRVCQFLDLQPGTDYLDACASIVLDKLEDHRGLVQWDPVSRNRVAGLVDKHPFLSGYRFDS